MTTLREELESILPPHLLPANVGEEVTALRNFTYVTEHDMGIAADGGGNWNYSLEANLLDRKFFTVSQDASFLLMAISCQFGAPLASWKGQPLTVKFTDPQSSRQFMNRSIPIQNYGVNVRPKVLPAPFYIAARASMVVEVSTFYAGGATTVPLSNTTISPGKPTLTFNFFGYRIKVEDEARVIAKIFAGQ